MRPGWNTCWDVGCYSDDVLCCFVLSSVVANGDLLNPVIRLLIQQRMQSPLEKIMEMITEKLGLRVLGGVRRYPSQLLHGC